MVIFVSRNAPGGCRSLDDLSLPEFPSLELLVPLEIDSLSSIFFESRIISLYRGCDIAHISVSRVIKRAGSFEWTGRRAGIGYRDVNGRQVGRDASSTRAHRRTHVHIRMQSAMLRRTPLSPVN